MKPQKIIVMGGTGFVGRVLVRRLAEEGHEVVVLSRNLGRHPDRLLPPDVALREVDVYDPETLRQNFAGADAVVNLVGILNESGDDGRGFQRVFVELTRLVIAACQSSGTRRLLQMSSLNAGRGTSFYLRARGEAEAAVKASGLHWTLFEPSVIFGPGDGLFCRFAALLRTLPVLPLARAQARFAPVHVENVADAYLHCLYDSRTIGEVYELYGPDVFTLRQIVQMTARQLALRRGVLPLPDVLGRLQGMVFDFVPGKPFSSDNFRSLKLDSVGGIDGLHRLGIAPIRVEEALPEILGHRDDRQKRFARYRSMR